MRVLPHAHVVPESDTLQGSCFSCCCQILWVLPRSCTEALRPEGPQHTHALLMHHCLVPMAMRRGSMQQACRTPPDAPPLLQVYGLPTFILFKDGQQVVGSKREGAVTKAMLQAYLTKNGIMANANVSS
jgi:hypothetical protein